MSPVWFRLRTEARSRWRAWAALALLIGIFSGAVIATAAGARRTDTAYPRFLVAQRAADLLVFNVPSLGHVDVDQLQKLPQVEESSESTAFSTTDTDLLVSPIAGGYGTRFNRFKLLSGRLPDPSQADEAVIGFTLAQSRHLKVGGHVRFGLLPRAGPEGSAATAPAQIDLRVVGIEASPGEFPPLIGSANGAVWVGAGFAQTYGGAFQNEGQVVALRLRHGSADVEAVSTWVQQMSGGQAVPTVVQAEQARTVEHSLHLQAVALLVLAVLSGVTVLLVCSQLLARQTRLESTDHSSLSALGMTGPQLWALGLVRGALIGAAGAVTAAAVAVGASPLFPIGVARVAEPRSGLSVHGGTVGLGLLAVLNGVVALVALSSWRSLASRPAAPRGVSVGARPSTVSDVLARAGLPPTLTTGVRMSLDPGRGRDAVPVRTTIIGSVVAMTALAAALTFQASLSHLLSTPQLYGTAFDAQIEQGGGEDFTVTKAMPVLLDDPEVAAVAVGYAGFPVRLGGVAAGAVALDVKKGSFPSILVEGRAPSQPDEVAVGTRTLRDLGARVGQTVEARSTVSDAPPATVRIVGRAVLPAESDTSGLGQGTLFSGEGLARVAGRGALSEPTQAVVRFQPGVDTTKARARLGARLNDVVPGGAVLAPTRPNDVVDFGHVQNLPVVLAAGLAVLAAATIGHLLVSSVRRRRHELAVLKSIGFVRRQIAATVCWQAMALVVISCGLGAPLGVALGHWTWDLLADQLGILPRPTTPMLTLLVLAPTALALANALAAGPAWSAGRTSAAAVLRSE